MKKLFKLTALAFFCTILTVPGALAQESPRETVTGTVAGSALKLNYGSPSVRGRKIWNGLVPYGKLWRTGANETTEFSNTKDIKIGDKVLHAGAYSVFTLPGENQWKVIFNSETGQWGIRDDGSANDDPAKDVLTVEVKPTKSATFHERLSFAIDEKGLTMFWENLELSIPIN